jgi:hypothetical protein
VSRSGVSLEIRGPIGGDALSAVVGLPDVQIRRDRIDPKSTLLCGDPKMKRIAQLIVLGCALACITGCDEVKRRAGEAARGEAQGAADKLDRKARESVRNAADSSLDKATGSDEAASADKRKKLKGGDEEDK